MDLQTFWFLLVGVLMMGYAILDGFDLGVGILHPFVREERDRRIVLNSIGPLWDGNEVWLVTFGGALFAAFPEVYATILSAFYLPVMVILFSLIGRAISLEFRSKVDSKRRRAYWDFSFFLSSFVVTFVFGVALGNVVQGFRIGADREYVGTLVDLFGAFPIAVGLLAVAGAAMHGSIYLHLKTEGALQKRVAGWMWKTFFVFLAAYVVETVGPQDYTFTAADAGIHTFNGLVRFRKSGSRDRCGWNPPHWRRSQQCHRGHGGRRAQRNLRQPRGHSYHGCGERV